MVAFIIDGVRIEEKDLDFRTKILIAQEMNGKNHLYRCLMVNEDECGDMWKDRIVSELKGDYTNRDFVSYSEFANLCAEIEEWYWDNFNEDVDEDYIGKTIFRLIDYESDINVEDLNLPWYDDWIKQMEDN